MRGIDELDHYDLLEIGREASPAEIDRAYRAAQHTYAEGSLALYSVFESRDASAIRDRFDEAYRVLSDPELRGNYDQEMPGAGAAATRSGDSGSASFGHFGDRNHGSAPGQADGYGRGFAEGGPGAPDESMHVALDGVDFDSVENAVEEFDAIEDDGRGEFDGVRLRRNRLFRGYELDDISEVTKVSGAHLRNIEEENFIDLPADVYVRGFVTAYAQTIGLDPNMVVPSYMARVTQSRRGESRARFRARR